MVNTIFLITLNIFMSAHCLPSIPSCGNYCRALSSGVTVTWRPECTCIGNNEIISDYSPHIFSWHSTIEEQGNPYAGTPKTKTLAPIIHEDAKILKTFKVPETVEIENNQFQYMQLDQESDEINLNNVKFREQDFAECIELHILKSLRSCNTTADAADFNNLEDYINISDDELAQEIENKCKEVNYVIENSLKEIRGKLLSKITHNNKNYQPNALANKAMKQKIVVDGYSYNTTPDPIYKDSTNTITIKGNRKQNIPNTENVEWLLPNDHIFPEFETISNAPTPENKEIYEPFIKYISNNDQLLSPTTTPYIHYDGVHHTTQPLDYETVTVAIEPTPTEYIESQPYISNSLDYSYIHTDTEPIETEPNALDRRNTSTSSQDNKIDYFYPQEQTFIKDNPPDNINGINNNKRCLYEDTSIVKIVSREYPNGTVLSEIQGTEPLTDDFTNNNPSILITKLQKNNTVNNIYHEVDSKQNQKITGQLYFVHDGKQVPTRFIQETDGNIRLGLDALTICENICSCSCTNANN